MVSQFHDNIVRSTIMIFIMIITGTLTIVITSSINISTARTSVIIAAAKLHNIITLQPLQLLS